MTNSGDDRGAGEMPDPVAIDGAALDELNDRTMRAAIAMDRARRCLLGEMIDLLEVNSFRRDGALNATTWLRRRAGVGRDEARRIVRQAGLLARRRDLAEAVFTGTTSLAHLDLIAKVATDRRTEAFEAHGDQLVQLASEFSVDDYEHICHHWAAQADEHISGPPNPRDHHLTLTPTLFGEADIHGHLNTHATAAVGAAFDELCRPDPTSDPTARTLSERRADALGDLAHHFLNQPTSDKTTAPSRGRTRPEAIVVLDWDTLNGSEPVDLATIRRELLAGGAIPARIADQFTCDANIRRLVLDPAGQPLNIGQPTPTITVAQRRALAIRDRGCVFPTCDRPAMWTDAHHLHHRSQGGPTDLDNLVLLCRRHHRLVHGPEWDITRHPTTGTVTATRSDGTIYQRARDGTITINERLAHPRPKRE